MTRALHWSDRPLNDLSASSSGEHRCINDYDPAAGATPLIELSIVIPCLDEARTLPAVLEKAKNAIRRLGLRGEIVVADNGSTDGSQAIALEHGARVVHVSRRGYGAALKEGIARANGHMVIMGDADDTYDFGAIEPFVTTMRAGAPFVMGTRLGPGRILPSANPWLNRYVGTPALTAVLNHLFGIRVHDVNCGMRGFLRSSFSDLELQSDGMEFASEMLIKAAQLGLPITEVPVTLHRDRRGKPTHLRRWHDGWRHLELMLLNAPDQLLFRPGFILLILGILVALPVSFGPIDVAGRCIDFHCLFYGGTFAMVGLQGVLGALLTRALIRGKVVRRSRRADAIARNFTLGRGLLVTGCLIAVGAILQGLVLAAWAQKGFEHLSEPRRAVLGMLFFAAGAEIGTFSIIHATLVRHLGPAPARSVRAAASTPAQTTSASSPSTASSAR
jgi:glycosyltransferase involved in cell wall biosynthesis